MPEISGYKTLSGPYAGICSDFIKNIKEGI